MGKDTQETTVLTKSSSAVVREFSSGGVVYKNEGEKVLWLIGKSTPSKRFPETYWRLPKGWMDDRDGGDNPGPISSGEVKATDNDLKTGALREVKEEVGVEAKIISKLPTSQYFTNSSRGRVMKFVTYFLMEWVRDIPEGFDFETSETAWLPYKEAIEKLHSPNEKEVLKKAEEFLTK